jgi:serine/threonine-protein phosphatase 2B regulatory subunit
MVELGANPFTPRIFQLFDTDGDGLLDLDEFTRAITQFSSLSGDIYLAVILMLSKQAPQLTPSLTDPTMMEEFLFTLYDIDQDGFVSSSELFGVLNGMVGITIGSESQLEAIVGGVMKEFDLDGDGQLSLTEFKALIQGQGASTRLGIELEG